MALSSPRAGRAAVKAESWGAKLGKGERKSARLTTRRRRLLEGRSHSHGDSNDVIESIDEPERVEGFSKDGDVGGDGSDLSRGSEDSIDHVELNVLVGSVSKNHGSSVGLSDRDVGSAHSIDNDDLGSVSRKVDVGVVGEKGTGDCGKQRETR